MPERWQQEVKKLRGIQPSADVWRRAEQGPREPDGPSLPPRRQRVVAGVVAFVVFLAAGGFAWRALRPTAHGIGGPSPSAATITATFKVVRGEQGGSGPSGTLTTPSGAIDGTFTSYSWATGSSVGNFDTVVPEFADKDFVPVTTGSVLVVESDAPKVDGALEAQGSYPFEGVESFGQIGDPVQLDQPPGKYILHLTPTWDEGTVDYYFPIELVAPPGSTGSSQPILTTVGKNAPEAKIAFGDDSQRGVRSQYEWCDDSGNCVNAIADFASYPPVDHYLPIPAGTTIEVQGDATSFTGSYQRADDQGAGSSSFGEGKVPDEPGRYVLTLDVAFDHGSASFFFGIDVTSDVTGGSASMSLAASSWRLVSVDGVTLPATYGFTLSFTADRLSGNDGCNDYGASYEVVGTTIRYRDWFSTLVLCQGAPRQEVLMGALARGNTFERTQDRLTITSASTTVTFEPDPGP